MILRDGSLLLWRGVWEMFFCKHFFPTSSSCKHFFFHFFFSVLFIWAKCCHCLTEIFYECECMSRTTAAWTILSIVFWILFVCVVHEINWLLKYVLSCNDRYNQDRRILFFTYSFEENTWYMRFCRRTKCWQVTLRFDCHNKFPFFQEIFRQSFSDLSFA